MRSKWVVGVAIVAGALGLVLRLHPQAAPPPPPPGTISSPPARSFVIVFGIGSSQDLNWNGAASVTGANILEEKGWRFDEPDKISNATTTGFDFSFATKMSPHDPSGAYHEENGLIITVADGPPANFTVTYCSAPAKAAKCKPTTNFSFTSDQAFETVRSFQSGAILVYRVPAMRQLTNTPEEEDYPAMAQSGDDVYFAYTRVVHGDRKFAQPLNIKSPSDLPDFDVLARPTGGDQVLMMHYSKSKRVWTGPFPVTSAGEDIMRTAVAVDGAGLAWVFYSARRSDNSDVFAKSITASGTASAEIRITTDPGPDLWPVAAADSSGRVWVAWQGYRGSNLQILASAEQAVGSTPATFTPETVISSTARNNWDPAIAAAPSGEVAIAWDTYEKGDYDVYVRRVHFGDPITMDPPIPVATTEKFEARASLVYDASSVLWIAYEVSGPSWGKDFGAYDSSGIPLYQNHNIEVRFVVGNKVNAPSDDVSRVLPGQAGEAVDSGQPLIVSGLMFPICSGTNKAQAPPPATGCITLPDFKQPDIALATGRTPGKGLPRNLGAENSFPRLATDGGTIYLAYRVFNGLGVSTGNATGPPVGSIWSEQLVYFDGSRWNGPGIFDNSDGLLDNRPAMVPLAAGQVLIAQATDHRLSPLREGTPQLDGVDSDIYALELQVQTTGPVATPPPGSPVAAQPGAPAPATTSEDAAAALLRNYRTTFNGETVQLVRGDFHRHTELSFDGFADGPLVDAYRYGIDAAAMDWFSCCDHDNGGAREYSWWLAQKYTDAYLLGDAFVPVFYYERSLDWPRGHRNVMFQKRGVRPLPRLPPAKKGSTSQPDTQWLYSYLRFFSQRLPYGNRGRTAAHTSATSQGTDWSDNDRFMEPMVEIYQGDRQSYEACPQITGEPCTLLPAMPNTARSNHASDSISGYHEPGYVSNALITKKYMLGFEASSDHVSTHISFTNLWVTARTRAGILDAVSQRHTYGSTDYILADFRSGSHMMGDAFTTTSPPVFSVVLQGTAPFAEICIVKNDVQVYATSGGPAVSFTWQDSAATKGTTSYYYVRGQQVTQSNQAQGEAVWVSPIWVTYQ